MPTTTRERIHQAADRAGWDVGRRQGIFDELTRDGVKIVVMYTGGTDAVLRAHYYAAGAVLPTASISSTEQGKATKLINWLAR